MIKKIAFLKGPGNKSKYRLSFKKFCVWRVAERKKILRIWTASGAKQKIYRTFNGRKSIASSEIFFPPKDLVIFWSTSDTIPKRRLFFPWTDFPPKDLRVFFDKSFSSRDLLFFQIVPRPFKSANYAINGFWRNHGSPARYSSLIRESKEKVWETLFNSLHVSNLLASPLVQIWKKKKKK